MNIEERIKSESRKLSDFYYPYYMEERYPGATKNFTPVNIKFWQNKVFFAYKKYFEKAAQMFCIRENFDAEKFIKSFMLDGFKYPQQMCNEYVWQTYIKYVPAIHNEKSDEKKVVEEIVEAALELKRNNSIKEWMNKKSNQIAISQNKIKFSPLLLAFSSSFIDFCLLNKCDYYYDFPLMRKRVLDLNISEKILIKIKEVLKEDYYKQEEDLDELVKELNNQGIIW